MLLPKQSLNNILSRAAAACPIWQQPFARSPSLLQCAPANNYQSKKYWPLPFSPANAILES